MTRQICFIISGHLQNKTKLEFPVVPASLLYILINILDIFNVQHRNSVGSVMFFKITSHQYSIFADLSSATLTDDSGFCVSVSLFKIVLFSSHHCISATGSVLIFWLSVVVAAALTRRCKFNTESSFFQKKPSDLLWLFIIGGFSDYSHGLHQTYQWKSSQ